MASVVALCWVALALWEGSPYSSYLHHESLSGATVQEVPLLTVAFSGGWILMIGAMMIPTIFPLLIEFGSVARSARGRCAMMALFVGGFVGVWVLVGVALFFSDFWLHKVVEENPFLARRSFFIPTFALVVCGVYQFTQFKRNLLAKCRQTRASIHGECLECSTGKQVLRFSLRHGYFSIGVCGTFMLLMFAGDVGTLWSMALAGGAMMVERYASSLEKVINKFGFGLIGAAVAYASVAAIHP